MLKERKSLPNTAPITIRDAIVNREFLRAGKAWYVATSPEPKFLKDLMQTICNDHGIEPVLKAPEGVEVTKRVKEGVEFTFVLNHMPESKLVPLEGETYVDLLTGEEHRDSCEVPARGVMILEKLG